MGGYIGAIDQGTTSSRFIVFDKAGSVVGLAQKEHEQIFPKPGWVEHDPLEIWRNTTEVISDALSNAGIEASELAAVGITNQRETTVVWDRRTGEPVHNALVWQDTRADDICTQLARDGGRDRLRDATGLPLASYFSGPKLRWILDNVADARSRAANGDLLFGTIDTWLIWQLTGGPNGGRHATDVTNASRTQLMTLAALQWDPALLEVFDIPAALLPEIVPSSGIIAEANIDALRGVPIAGVAGDQQAALIGQTCFEPGEAKNTYGTGCFLLMNTGQQRNLSRNGLLTTICCDAVGGAAYALEGSVFMGGATVQWLRDELRVIDEAHDTERIARSLDGNDGVYLVPAFAGLGAPYWDMDARAAIVGLTRGSGRAQIVRAALESIAYQSRDLVEAMNRDGRVDLSELRVDGGAAGNDFLMQFQADLLGVAVDRPGLLETTAAGAAFLAGLAVGVWNSPADLEQVRQQGRAFVPRMSDSERNRLYGEWQSAVERVLSGERA